MRERVLYDACSDTVTSVIGSVSAGDFSPWLKMVGGIAGGLMGGGAAGAPGGAGGGAQLAAQQALIQQQQAAELERARAAEKQAREAAARNQMILFGVVGLAAIGGLVLILKK